MLQRSHKSVFIMANSNLMMIMIEITLLYFHDTTFEIFKGDACMTSSFLLLHIETNMAMKGPKHMRL